MKSTRNILFGLFLLVAGVYFLLVNFGVAPMLTENNWVWVFAASSLFFLAIYLSSGWREWGWLFPVTIGAALAVIGLTVDKTISGEVAGSIFLWSVAVPFWVARFARRGNWWAVIPAGVLTVVGFIPLLAAGDNDFLIPVLMMYGLALVFLGVYFQKRTQWWALFPVGALSAVGTIILLAESNLSGELIDNLIVGSLFGFLALAFGAVYWFHRPETRWAIYPAAILGGMSALGFISGENAELAFPVLLIGFGTYLLLRRKR